MEKVLGKGIYLAARRGTVFCDSGVTFCFCTYCLFHAHNIFAIPRGVRSNRCAGNSIPPWDEGEWRE